MRTQPRGKAPSFRPTGFILGNVELGKMKVIGHYRDTIPIPENLMERTREHKMESTCVCIYIYRFVHVPLHPKPWRIACEVLQKLKL